MENKVKLLIELGLQRDEDQGDVAVVAFDFPRSVAERVCREQEKCTLLNEGGELTKLINAYALLNGYQCAWFIRAERQESSECKVQSAELLERLMKSFMHCRHSDTDDNACDGCPYEEVKYCASEQARDSLTLFALWKTELEGMIKRCNAHELAGKLFEMKNTELEKKLEVADAERADAVKKAIYRMREELKAGRIHFDGISLKAIPFDSVDAVAEKVLREVADGTEK